MSHDTPRPREEQDPATRQTTGRIVPHPESLGDRNGDSGGRAPAQTRRLSELANVNVRGLAGARLAEHWMVPDEFGVLLRLGARVAPAGN